jgi:hypothetical protein
MAKEKPEPIDVPEADSLEQERDWSENDKPDRPRIDIGVPEADALDQSRPVPVDDEEQR